MRTKKLECFTEDEKFLVHLSGRIVEAFGVHENRVSGVYNSWSILKHSIHVAKSVDLSVDLERMESELRDPVEKHVIEEYNNLLERSKHSFGDDWLAIMETAEHRKLILSLGKSVLVLEKRTSGYALRAKGILEDLVDYQGIVVSGKFYRMTLNDLVEGDSIVRLDNPGKAFVGGHHEEDYVLMES